MIVSEGGDVGGRGESGFGQDQCWRDVRISDKGSERKLRRLRAKIAKGGAAQLRREKKLEITSRQSGLKSPDNDSHTITEPKGGSQIIEPKSQGPAWSSQTVGANERRKTNKGLGKERDVPKNAKKGNWAPASK